MGPKRNVTLKILGEEEGTQKGMRRRRRQKNENGKRIKSAIRDLCRRNNHIMDCEKSKVIASQSNR